ncbi:hypothetical protein NAEGRDRAFT_57821 [Naegleria gruberi]|uniref:F-box domain-containing protein n=1 Tax=Naegleria gruberi TaxID=5762 RepID=D2VCV5_NAEGR|nr:uncharacterized protein NAEGRDRAFT_57821 [Naegleria gruberi]EFC45371.1 hypothetical protein NAEGRDRAFT_57821 [Naegleria gruberi]|eukprot:XP_002678115.1 hypothetical protein NAEGRDRAFT_57821 [Naegleria gruberi strain NEG-M]
MAQHLPPELLQLIISFIPPSEYLKNNVITVCSDWFELGEYEMFWLATLKSLLQEEIFFTENEECEFVGVVHYTFLDSLFNFKMERESYAQQLKRLEQILIFDRKPFQLRRETNSDIFGKTYWKRSRQFVTERRRRRIMLEVLRRVIQMGFSANISEWIDIVKFIKSHKDLKSIARYNYAHVNLANLFLFHYAYDYFKVVDQKWRDFAYYMLDFFFNECETPILDCIERIFKMKLIRVFNDKSLGLFEKFKKELVACGKKGVPDYFIVTLLNSADMTKAEDIEIVTKFVTLIRDRKQSKFTETIAARDVNSLFLYVRGNWECIEFYLKVLEVQKYQQFSPKIFIDNIIRNSDPESCNIIGILRRIHNEYGLEMNYLSKFLVQEKTNDLLLFFVDECGANVNQLIGESDNSFLISECIHATGLRRSQTELILTLMERGATIPNHEFFSTIFNNYFDREELYLPTLKKLVEKYGPRFDSLDFFSYHVKYIDDGFLFSPKSLVSVFQYFVEYLGSKQLATRDLKENIQDYCSRISNNWFDINLEEVEELKKKVKELFGFTITTK